MTHGVKLTDAEYTQAVVALQERQPARPTAGQELAQARQEFELRVHHRLGQDFPRMDALWSAHCSLDRYRPLLPFLGWRGRRILVGKLYSKVLSEAEVKEFLDEGYRE